MDNVTEPKVEEVKENIQQNTEAAAAPAEETQEQINWKKFREKREEERKKNEALQKENEKKSREVEALKAAMEALVSKPSPPQQQMYEPDETEEQRIRRQVNEAIAEKEKKNEEARKEREQQEFPQRLVSTFTDFDKVCSTENLDYLEYHYPEVAAPYKHLAEGFDKWAQIYKAVKRFVPNPESGKDQKKAEKNFNKPQSMSADGRTQTTDSAPVMLNDKRRADNWSRMQRVMRGGK